VSKTLSRRVEGTFPKEKTMKEQPNEPPAAPRPGNGNQQRQGRLPERAQEAADRARDAAIEKVETARDRARDEMEQGRQQVAERIRRLSSALRSASDTLREDDRVAARYADYAGETIERAANYIGSADIRRTARDIEGFARRQPAVFFGSAFLLGLAAGRFLKSSQGRDRDHERFEPAHSSERITPTDWPSPSRQGSVPAPAERTGGTGGGPRPAGAEPFSTDPRRGST
jgi:hypothetical protein